MSTAIAERLSDSVDQVNEAMFYGREITKAERERLARVIASRQGLPGAYAGTFALTDEEKSEGLRLFTGERIQSASMRHVIGQEACRALRWLNAPAGAEALKRASGELARCVGPAAPTDKKPDDGRQHWLWPYRGGTYCCGTCSVGFWRHLTAGGYDEMEKRLARGMKCLKACRRPGGDWRVFPLWYTLSALIEMEFKPALEEMRYAAPQCEALLKRRVGGSAWSQRRAETARRVLAKV